jgi:hypothetical protein
MKTSASDPMKKLKEPQKKIIVNRNERLYEEPLSLGKFLSWVSEHASGNIEDITISVEEELDDDYYSDGGIIAAYIQISWKEEIDNPHYEIEMKKYQRSLARQKKKNGKS